MYPTFLLRWQVAESFYQDHMNTREYLGSYKLLPWININNIMNCVFILFLVRDKFLVCSLGWP